MWLNYFWRHIIDKFNTIWSLKNYFIGLTAEDVISSFLQVRNVLNKKYFLVKTKNNFFSKKMQIEFHFFWQWGNFIVVNQNEVNFIWKLWFVDVEIQVFCIMWVGVCVSVCVLTWTESQVQKRKGC